MPVFLLNSRLSHFTATSVRLGSKSFHRPRHLLSRSYEARLPSSLTKVLPITLGLLSPPTSVGLRYGCLLFYLREFSWQCRFSWIALDCSAASPCSQLLALRWICLSEHDLLHETHHVQWVRPTYLTASSLRLKRKAGSAGI